MKLLKLSLLMGAFLMINACTPHKVTEYTKEQPTLKLEEYFDGPIKAWGIIQDRKGRVTTRFDIKMEGSWENGVGTLKEDFDYYGGNEGKTTKRVWTIHKIDDTHYKGEASDIIGSATGEIAGNSVRWSYVMDIPVDNKTYRITLDDWMFLMNDDVLINRSYLKKFGITVAELTLFMQKQEK